MFLGGKRLVALHLDQPSRCDPINVREREFLTMRKRRLALSGKLLNAVSEKTMFQAKERRRILRVIHVGD
jgi:hypothetical protein